MEHFVHLNGAVVARDEAAIPVGDRGFLFADAVYEGMGVLDGQVVDFLHHMERLERSLREISIEVEQSADDWWGLLMELVERNEIDAGFAYLHITRGVGVERDYVYPAGLTPSVFAFIERHPGPGPADAVAGIALATAPDLRWARRDIKTPNLLGQVLAKQHAAAQGRDEALLVTSDGLITECGSSSFFIVRDGALITRPLSHDILGGVTRRAVIAVAERLDLAVEERVVGLDEAQAADEAFATAASTYVQPVVSIDGEPVGAGVPGPVALAVREEYLRMVRASFHTPAEPCSTDD
ncbi:MAG: aminotransferase class IV [Acidimicrobiales bacterium]|nr:aminotransferase class IV [Acidimicrobiales bacterium]